MWGPGALAAAGVLDGSAREGTTGQTALNCALLLACISGAGQLLSTSFAHNFVCGIKLAGARATFRATSGLARALHTTMGGLHCLITRLGQLCRRARCSAQALWSFVRSTASQTPDTIRSGARNLRNGIRSAYRTADDRATQLARDMGRALGGLTGSMMGLPAAAKRAARGAIDWCTSAVLGPINCMGRHAETAAASISELLRGAGLMARRMRFRCLERARAYGALGQDAMLAGWAAGVHRIQAFPEQAHLFGSTTFETLRGHASTVWRTARTSLMHFCTSMTVEMERAALLMAGARDLARRLLAQWARSACSMQQYFPFRSSTQFAANKELQREASTRQTKWGRGTFRGWGCLIYRRGHYIERGVLCTCA